MVTTHALTRRAVVALALAVLTVATPWPVAAATGEGPRYRLRVDGLGCPFCAYGIEKRLSRLPGVTQVDVDLERGEVVVTVAPDATLSEQAAAEAVRKAGFTLRGFAPEPAP